MIRSMVHRLRRRAARIRLPGGRGAVLLYHRIADEVSDPYGLCVPPAQFDEHLQIIREVGRPMRLADFAHALRSRSLPDRAIAITFDDGYIDNLECAAPILARHDMPGLVFVTTGAGGREREFWWDELERVLLQPGELSASLEMEIAGTVHHWDLGDDRRYNVMMQQTHRSWNLLDEHAPTARHAVFQQLYSLLQPLEVGARTRALDALLVWAGRDAGTVRSSHRAMQPAEVAELAAGGVIDVGAHTVSHPALPAQPAHVQRTELEQSKRDLEAWTGRAVHGFAYPYGLYDDTAVATAREAGFGFACSGVYRHVDPAADLFLIPRMEAPATDGDALGRILRWQLQ